MDTLWRDDMPQTFHDVNDALDRIEAADLAGHGPHLKGGVRPEDDFKTDPEDDHREDGWD